VTRARKRKSGADKGDWISWRRKTPAGSAVRGRNSFCWANKQTSYFGFGNALASRGRWQLHCVLSTHTFTSVDFFFFSYYHLHDDPVPGVLNQRRLVTVAGEKHNKWYPSTWFSTSFLLPNALWSNIIFNLLFHLSQFNQIPKMTFLTQWNSNLLLFNNCLIFFAMIQHIIDFLAMILNRNASIPRSQKKGRELGLAFILTVDSGLCVVKMYLCASKPPSLKSL
jgi:hypothetical protein